MEKSIDTGADCENFQGKRVVDSEEEVVVRMRPICTDRIVVVRRRGMKPTIRTCAQNPLLENFQVAVAVQTTINSSHFGL